MKKYSVLLLYPENLTEGIETYYGTTRASNTAQAISNVKDECMEGNESWLDRLELTTLLITKGFNEALNIPNQEYMK